MNTPGTRKPVEILMVEDSDTDALFAREAFAEARLANTLHVVADGVKAFAFLRKQAPYTDAPRPDLILLDLNLPKKSGFEVLAEIKADEDLRMLPVLVLTTSNSYEDVLKSYKLQANAFITKPITLKEYADAVAAIEQFWFVLATLPPCPQAPF